MQLPAPEEAKIARKLVFHRVAENLYRLETSGGYYALVKRGDKQFRRSLKTKDRKLAERRLTDFRNQVGALRVSEEKHLSFEDLAARWMAATSHTIKKSTVTRRGSCINNLTPFFAGLSVRNIQPQHCERWLTDRGQNIAAQTMANELHVLKPIFEYAVKLGLMLSNPARDIKRRKLVQKRIVVPSREQFRKLVQAIRESDGRLDSQEKAKAGADLVELLAYSGCRLAEACALTWGDADFEKNTLTIRGGQDGTKNYEQRVRFFGDWCGITGEGVKWPVSRSATRRQVAGGVGVGAGFAGKEANPRLLEGVATAGSSYDARS
jgi:integrase